MKNKDDNGLRWSLRAALFPPKDQVDRPSNYPTEDGLNYKGVNTPTPINQLYLVGRQNQLAINVYGWEERGLAIYRLSRQ